jgi:hypothetical protein
MALGFLRLFAKYPFAMTRYCKQWLQNAFGASYSFNIQLEEGKSGG